MDNFFTFSRTIAGMRALGVAVVGTARAKRGWPPKEIKNVKDERFNTLYWINDQANYKIMRWVDNNIVTMVSTIHEANETIVKVRKKPRITFTNRQNLEAVWGNNFEKAITIPKVIDNYNHWMLGVDKCDQLIAYYRHNLCCR